MLARLRALTPETRGILAMLFAFLSFAVMDERYCFERTQPWLVENQMLALSWYGGPPPGAPQPREVLHDRRSGAPDRGHSLVATDAPEVAERLREQGRAWIKRVETMRRAYQPVSWLRDGPTERDDAP